MRAAQRKLNFLVAIFLSAESETEVLRLGNILSGPRGNDTTLAAPLADYATRNFRLRGNYDNAPSANDGGLFRSNLGERLPQVFLMIERDGCDGDGSRADCGG